MTDKQRLAKLEKAEALLKQTKAGYPGPGKGTFWPSALKLINEVQADLRTVPPKPTPKLVYPITGVAKVTICQGLHPTDGLPGNWAIDFCCAPGTGICAPERATVTRFSGHDPSDDQADRRGVFGWNTYLQTPEGYVYFITHQGARLPTLKPGMRVEPGDLLGFVGNQRFRPDHLHLGVSSPHGQSDAKARITSCVQGTESVLMALGAWPEVPNDWLEDYIVWRINSGDPDFRPPEVPPTVPRYALECLNWCVWRRKGRPLPRPDVIKNIPGWAYAVLDGVNERAPIQIPTPPASWMLSWCIWRFQNSPPPKPPNIPKEVSVVAPYCWSVLNWMAWKRAQIPNPSTPRPTNIPKSIPSWCFAMLRSVNQAVPPKPPPPPPPPPDPDRPPTSWHLPNPVMFTSWGWFSDARYRDNDEALQDMRAAGIKTVALQVAGGQPLYNPDVPGRCRAFGMKVALWGRAAPGDAECLALAKADGYMPQIEGPGEYDDAVAQLAAGTGAGLSLSTITTLGAMTDFIWLPPSTTWPQGRISTTQCERLKEFGLTHGWIECYIQDGGAHFPISTMMWSADQRGFPWFNPAIGLYHETSVSAYRPLSDPNSLDSFGKQFGVYLSEGMIPQNWTEIAALGT